MKTSQADNDKDKENTNRGNSCHNPVGGTTTMMTLTEKKQKPRVPSEQEERTMVVEGGGGEMGSAKDQ